MFQHQEEKERNRERAKLEKHNRQLLRTHSNLFEGDNERDLCTPILGFMEAMEREESPGETYFGLCFVRGGGGGGGGKNVKGTINDQNIVSVCETYH